MGADQRLEELIHHYAKARVGVRKIANAIGFLALLWSTVVLLGGFVSVLQIKDFWCLSVLSFLLASKMLEFLDTKNGGIFFAEKNILHSSNGLDQLEEANRTEHWIIIFTLSAVTVVKQISMIILVCIFGFSWQVSIALSVVRLVQRDYGDAGGDATSRAKLNAALVIFYVLVIFHSLSVGYWGFLDIFEPWILVSKQFGFGFWGPKIVKRYRTETRVMCYKDGVLPNNWNLITFSVGLLESASPEDRLWGARVLDTFIGKGISVRQELLSSSQSIQNLINMIIGSTRTDDTEIRERSARIVADLTSELSITQFQDLQRCICCLLESCMRYTDPQVANSSENSEQTPDKNSHEVSVETLEHDHQQEDPHLSLAITEQTDPKQVVNLASVKAPKKRSGMQTLFLRMTRTRKEMRDWEKYFGGKYYYSYASKGTKELISQGLVILERLTQDENNCIEIIQHQRLLSKITLPVCYQDLLSHGWDHTWAEMLSRSLTVVSRLIRAGPEEDTTRLRHDMSRNTVAIGNLMHILEVDSEGAFSELRGQAIEILAELAFVDSFGKLTFDESTSMAEMLIKMLRHILLEESDGVVAKQDEEKDKRVRRKAGEALARLLRVPSARDNTDAWASATNVNVVYLLPNQDAVNLLTKVVDQILSSEPKKATRVGTRPSSTKENDEQSEDRKILVVMLSNTVVICNKNVISGDDFTRAIPDDATLVKKLKEIVEMDEVATTDGWRIQKLVCQVVIAVVQLKPSCIRKFNGHNFKEALAKVLEIMKDVDNCMIFAGDDREVPARSLTSLVKEAQELLAQERGDMSV